LEKPPLMRAVFHNVIVRILLFERPLTAAHLRGRLRRVCKETRDFIDKHCTPDVCVFFQKMQLSFTPMGLSFDSIARVPFHVRTQYVTVRAPRLSLFANWILAHDVYRMLSCMDYAVIFHGRNTADEDRFYNMVGVMKHTHDCDASFALIYNDCVAVAMYDSITTYLQRGVHVIQFCLPD